MKTALLLPQRKHHQLLHQHGFRNAEAGMGAHAAALLRALLSTHWALDVKAGLRSERKVG